MSSPAHDARLHGLTLAQLSSITATSRQTLANWHRKKPALWQCVLLGAKQFNELSLTDTRSARGGAL